MSTQVYLKNVAPHQPFSKDDTSKFAKTCRFFHEHPTTFKVLRLAGCLLGIAMLAASPFIAPTIGAIGAVAVGITGALILTISGLALYLLDLIIAPTHDMRHHTFKPASCSGGNVSYLGDVPVLTLTTSDPYEAGKAHGFLLGEAFHELKTLWTFAGHVLLYKKDSITETLTKIKETLPENYLKELQGLVDGYNDWLKGARFLIKPKPMDLDDALLLNLIPDSCHFAPISPLVELKKPPVACCVIIDRDQQKIPVFGRNLDWLSLGKGGELSLLIRRKLPCGSQTVELGIPGLIGTLTGIRKTLLPNGEEHLFALAMNVVSDYNSTVWGMPSIFFNRACLESNSCVSGAQKFFKANQPLGPYHLSLADNGGAAASIHFHQESEGVKHPIRLLNGTDPLVVTNKTYGMTQGENLMQEHSEAREAKIDALFIDAKKTIPVLEIDKRELIAHALALPKVNNEETTHTFVLSLQTGTLGIALNNAYSASTPLQTLTKEELFNF